MASARLRKDSDDKKDFSDAITYFERATTVDPRYAPAYVGLADAYTRMGMRRMLPVDDVKWKAKEAAERALELDPMMAPAYIVAGQIAAEFETRWSDSERLHRRALELEPGNSECHRSYANFVAMPALRFDEALSHFKQAELLDPFNNYLKVEVGRCLYNARRYREAIDKLSYIVNIAPDNIDGQYMLGLAYLSLRHYQPAIAHLEKAVALSDNAPGPLSYLSNALGCSGNRVRALILHKRLLSMSKTRYVPDHFVAISLIGQGRLHDAIAMLRKALLANTISGTFFDSPIYQDLRNNPEFVALSEQFPPPIPHKSSRP
jgi:serine/threonine-protein kinase